MTTQSGSTPSVRAKKGRMRFVIPAAVLLVVVVAVAVLVPNTKMVSLSGKGDSFVLEPGQTRLGILTIEEGAAATFREKSRWIGPIVSKQGSLTVEDGVTITGPVVLFSNPLRLGEKATVHGTVCLFSGGLTLERGASVDGSTVLFSGPLTLLPEASVRHHAILFAGGASLAEQARIGGDVISFAGPVELREKSTLRGDAVLFAGAMKLGSEAAMHGKLIGFAGGLELGPKAVLRDGAVVFAGDVHLYPGAQIRRDVILAEGNATLDGDSKIVGTLYLNPAERKGRGNLLQAPEAQVTGGVVTPEGVECRSPCATLPTGRPSTVESVASRQIGGWLALHLVRFLALPVIGSFLLVALVFYLGRRSGTQRHDRDARLGLAPSPQP